MKTKTLMNGSLLAASIIAVVICVGMVTGFSVVKPFISVDPVSDKNVGDQFTINGTTSLPVGTMLLWQIMPDTGTPPTGTNKTASGIAGGNPVTKGDGTANRLSFAADMNLQAPGKWVVLVGVMKGDEFEMGDLTGSAYFTVKQGPASAGTGQYIRVDPVADKTTGDLLIVTGSTNLPAGTILMVQTGSYGSDTIVHAGTGGVNQYSMPVDTSILKPGTLTITVTQMKGDPAKGDYEPGTVKGTASFTLKGTYLGVETPVQATITKDDYIRINAIGDRSVGDQFLITGMTSLPAGVGLIWEVMPYTGTIPTGLDMNAKGIMANNPVTKGDDTANRVSLAVDMNGFAPGKYVVLVGEFKGDPANRDIAMGDPVGSALFNLK